MKEPNVCKYCGRGYNHKPIVDGAFIITSVSGGYTGGFCSQKCREEARQLAERNRQMLLKKMQEKGQMTLEKWEKELDKEVKKRKDRMAKLDAAIRGDDPDAIIKAIKGGIIVRFCRLAWRIFLVWAFVALSTIVLKAFEIVWKAATEERTKKVVEVVNELPSLEAPAVPESQADTNVTSSFEEGSLR